MDNSSEKPSSPSTTAVDHFEWVAKYVGHVLGSSILFLPYVMGQIGIIPFLCLLVVELYVTGNSLNVFCEMAPREPDIDHTNYFTMVEQYLGQHPSLASKAIRIAFLLDVVICSAFYFKTAQELLFFCMADMTNPRHKTAYGILIFIVTACILLICESAKQQRPEDSRPQRWMNEQQQAESESKETEETPPQSQSETQRLEESRSRMETRSHSQQIPDDLQDAAKSTEVTLINCNIDKLFVRGENFTKNGVGIINMHAVVTRLHGYSFRRRLLLLLFSFLCLTVVAIFYDIWNDGKFPELDQSHCSGLQKPFFLTFDMKVFSAFPVIIYALMHYSIFLPVCLEELKLHENEYAKLVRKGLMVLFVILAGLPILVHLILGDSAPILFTTAFGCSSSGLILNLLASAITVIAMLLRITACCRLIQVLFDMESDIYFWIITICLFFISFVIALLTKSALYLVVIGGCTSSLLLIIFPRLAYIRFKRDAGNGRAGDRFSIFLTVACMSVHILLILSSLLILVFVDPYVGQRCQEFFNKFWS